MMHHCSFRCFAPFFEFVPVASVLSVRDLIATIQLLVVIPITLPPPAREMLHLIFFFPLYSSKHVYLCLKKVESKSGSCLG